MAKITVNPAALLANVQKMEEILADIAERESQTIEVVGDLASDWQGQDYTLFLAHYASTVTESSVYVQLYQILVNYFNYVRTAASLYSKAEEAATAEANAIGGGSFNARSAEAQNVLSGIFTALNIQM